MALQPSTLKALSVRQPWAWAIAHGGKDVENRSRRMNYVGPLAIQASKSLATASLRELPIVAAMARWRAEHGVYPDLGLGAIVAVVDVLGCHADSHHCCAPWGEAGTQHIELGNVRPLRNPVPATGQLGVWTLTPHQTRDVIREVVAWSGS